MPRFFFDLAFSVLSISNFFITMYNGLYSHCVSIVIEADNHEACNTAAARFRYLQKAWSFSVQIFESKSVLKGEVLKREVQFVHKGYASDIIAFGENVRIISNFLSNYQKISVRIIEHGCMTIEGYNYLTDLAYQEISH